MASAQSKYAVGSWKVGDGNRIYFPVLENNDQIANRIVEHERPGRPGAKLQSTGAKARRWTLRVIFATHINEPGADNDRPLFPDVYRQLQASFESEETGDLIIPGLGLVRAKASSMGSLETYAEDDTARCDCSWIADNEESLDRALILPPTVRATGRQQAEQTVFSAEAATLHDSDVRDLSDFAAELEGALQEPGRSINKVETLARRNRRAVSRIIAAGNQTAADVSGPLSLPRGSATERHLVILRDRQAAAGAERSSSLPRTIRFVIDVDQCSVFDVATRHDQDAEDLLDLNDARIADPFNLRRGDVVLVYQSTPRA